MFHIGGEQALAQRKTYTEITNSGRSSLRLILINANLAGKHILLPDFICQVVVDVLLEFDISFNFYTVDNVLSGQIPAEVNQYDAIYLVKYFGGEIDALAWLSSNYLGCLILDDVFSPFPQVLDRISSWYSFNSLRKISAVSDYSLVSSNCQLQPVGNQLLNQFSEKKYRAKHLKSEYLNKNEGDELDYLQMLSQAETLLDNSKGIYAASMKSLVESAYFYARLIEEKQVRQNNYDFICSQLTDWVIQFNSDFYSFLPVLLDNRDIVRKKLMSHHIFLAVHWPALSCVDNLLSDKILSIPLDSRYDQAQLGILCNLIKTYGVYTNTDF